MRLQIRPVITEDGVRYYICKSGLLSKNPYTNQGSDEEKFWGVLELLDGDGNGIDEYIDVFTQHDYKAHLFNTHKEARDCIREQFGKQCTIETVFL